MSPEHNGESFYQYAMKLFFDAGHIATFEPKFIDHSPEQFLYFDNASKVSFSREQQSTFKQFDDVSYLFSTNSCCFYSVVLLTTRAARSQAAHDIHTMIHSAVKADGTVCLFRYNCEVLLSFMGYGESCILSDWYPMDDDYDVLSNKLNIGNISIENGTEYFTDMVYALARNYYLPVQKTTIYDLLPINALSQTGYDELDREELDQIVQYELTEPEREYGYDYVEYDELIGAFAADIGADLDLMLLTMDDAIDNPFGEEVEAVATEEFLEDDEDTAEEERATYEFDGLDPEIFQDPTLMVKWLEAQESKNE